MVRPVVVYGGTAVFHQLSDLGKGAHIVVGTPGRLMDFIGKGKVSTLLPLSYNQGSHDLEKKNETWNFAMLTFRPGKGGLGLNWKCEYWL